MDIGKIIRKRRSELGLTQDQVAERVGISKPYLSSIETGRVKNPPTDGVLEALEEALGFEPGDLLRIGHLVRTPPDIVREFEEQTAQLQHLRSVVRKLMKGQPTDSTGIDIEHAFHLPTGSVVPVINSVAAGYPGQFTDLDYPPGVADEYIRCPGVSDPQAFAARVVGDSMEPIYHEGDIVVFSPNTPPRAGDDCFARFADGEGTTFKRFYQDDPREIRLQPLNSAYPAATYPCEQLTGLWPAVYRIEQLRRG